MRQTGYHLNDFVATHSLEMHNVGFICIFFCHNCNGNWKGTYLEHFEFRYIYIEVYIEVKQTTAHFGFSCNKLPQLELLHRTHYTHHSIQKSDCKIRTQEALQQLFKFFSGYIICCCWMDLLSGSALHNYMTLFENRTSKYIIKRYLYSKWNKKLMTN